MSKTTMKYAIVSMVLVWIVAMGLVLFCPSLRMRYWGWRLGRADTEARKHYYASRLAGGADDALGVAAELLRDSDPSIRLLAVDVIGRAKSSKADGLLLAALRDSQVEVRDVAALLLGKRSTPTLIGELSKLSRGGDDYVAAAAVFALQRSARQEAVDAIIDVFANARSVAVRVQAIESLGLLGIARARPMIEKSLADSRIVSTVPANERSVRRALAMQGSRPSAPGSVVSLPAVEPDRTVAHYAAKALKRIDREALGATRSTTRRAASRPAP